MALLENILLTIVILWAVFNLAAIRYEARNGETVFLSALSSTLVLSLMIILTLTAGLSRFHLLWMFPLSFILGFLLLSIPFTASIIMASVAILAWPLKNKKQ